MSQARPGTCQAAGQWPGAALRLRLVRVTGTLRTSSRRWPGPAAHRAADGEQVGPADGLARQHLLDHLLGRLCARRTALLPSLAWGPCSSRCTTTALFPFLAWRPCTSRCTTIALFYFYQKKKGLRACGLVSQEDRSRSAGSPRRAGRRSAAGRRWTASQTRSGWIRSPCGARERPDQARGWVRRPPCRMACCRRTS
jgi:hypothetical protein